MVCHEKESKRPSFNLASGAVLDPYLTNRVLTAALSGWYFYKPHFTSKKTEAQREKEFAYSARKQSQDPSPSIMSWANGIYHCS